MTRGHRDSVEIEIRRARRVESCSNWPRFLKPLYDPGRSDFPSPVLASALTVFVRARLPPRRETAVLAHPSPRHRGVCIAPSPRRKHRSYPAQRPDANPLPWPPSAQSPFARHGRYPRRGGLASRLERRYPLVVAHTGSCARPSPSQRLRFTLGRWVFAGRRQSLLRDGPSRHYLCDPCAGARTPTPPRSPAAHIRFFTEDTGLTPI